MTIDDDDDDRRDALFLWRRCYACGHRLRFAATGCPQCEVAFDGRRAPRRYPERCECPRCVEARTLDRVARRLRSTPHAVAVARATPRRY